MKTGYDRFIVPVKNLIDALTEQKKELVPKIRASLATFTNLVVNRTIKMTSVSAPPSDLTQGSILWPDEDFDPVNNTGKVPVAYTGLHYIPWGGYEVVGKDAIPTSMALTNLSVIYNGGTARYLSTMMDLGTAFGLDFMDAALKQHSPSGTLMTNRIFSVTATGNVEAIHTASTGGSAIGISKTSYTTGGYMVAYVVTDSNNTYLKARIVDAFLRDATTSEIIIDIGSGIKSPYVVHNATANQFMVSWIVQSGADVTAYAALYNNAGEVVVDKTAISTLVTGDTTNSASLKAVHNNTDNRYCYVFSVSIGVNTYTVFTVSRAGATLASVAGNTSVATGTLGKFHIAFNSFDGNYQIIYSRLAAATYYVTAKTLAADGITLTNTVDLTSTASVITFPQNSFDATNTRFAITWVENDGTYEDIKAVRATAVTNVVFGSPVALGLISIPVTVADPHIFYNSTLSRYVLFYLYGIDRGEEVRYAATDFVTVFGASGVTSLNSLTGDVKVSAGAGISVATASPTITVTNTGVRSVNGMSPTVSIVAGTGISVVDTSPTITISSSVATNSNSGFQVFDDFIGFLKNDVATNTNQGSTGSFFAQVQGTGTVKSYPGTRVDADHPGVITIGTGTSAGAYGAGIFGNGGSFLIGGGQISFETLIYITYLSILLDEYDLRFGLLDALSTGSAIADAVDGVYFEYDRNSSVNWRTCSANNSVRTKTNSSTAVVAGAWTKLKIVINAAATSAEFFVNGSSIGTVTTNLPTGAGRVCGPEIHIVSSNGASDKTVSVDYFDLNHTLTTPR